MNNFKKIDFLIHKLTKKIYKKQDQSVIILLEHWGTIVNSKLNKASYPLKINNEGILTVKIDRSCLIDFQYESPKILEKINALLETNTICKIKLLMNK